jgi:hypothetical protein
MGLAFDNFSAFQTRMTTDRGPIVASYRYYSYKIWAVHNAQETAADASCRRARSADVVVAKQSAAKPRPGRAGRISPQH